MPRLTRIYTRKGDGGKTQLGGGQVVPKDDARIAAMGDLDELNALLGVIRSLPLPSAVATHLRRVQNELFDLGAEICFAPEDLEGLSIPLLDQRHVTWLEEAIEDVTPRIGALDNFVLPGGAASAAHLHTARAVCRRAERSLVRLFHLTGGRDMPLRYVNRLSDALFVWARLANHAAGVPETLWRPGGAEASARE